MLTKTNDVPNPDDAASMKYGKGLHVVRFGIIAILVIFFLSLLGALLGIPAVIITALVSACVPAIGALAAAYFGINMGLAQSERNEAEKDAAKTQTAQLALRADPDDKLSQQALGLVAGP